MARRWRFGVARAFMASADSIHHPRSTVVVDDRRLQAIGGFDAGEIGLADSRRVSSQRMVAGSQVTKAGNATSNPRRRKSARRYGVTPK